METQKSPGMRAAGVPAVLHEGNGGGSGERSRPKGLPEDSLSPEIHRRRFRGLDHWGQEAEGPRELCSRLHRLCRQWLRPENSSKREMLDLVVLEQLLVLLPAEMASWVRECGAESCSQAVALAEGFLLSQAQREEPGKGQQVQESSAKLQGRGDQSSPSQKLLFRRIQIEPPCQGSGPFEEVAVDFTEEEWMLLDSGQKALCWEVIREVSMDMAALADDGLEKENDKKTRLKPLETGKCEVEVMFGHQGDTKRQERIHSVGGEKSSTSLPVEITSFLYQHDLEGKKKEKRGKKEENQFDLHEYGKSQTKQKLYRSRQYVKYVKNSFALTLPKKEYKKHEPHNAVKSGRDSSQSREMKLCLKCGKSFGSKSKLNLHQRIHTGEKPHKCLECGKSFTQKGYLKCHKRIHAGDKPYKCLECGKSFTQKGNLNYHERIHTGNKLFKCMECGKSFVKSRNLNCHQKMHTKERPYKCMECGRTFFGDKELIRHQMIHSGNKPHKCLECGKSFTQKGDFNSHRRAHTGERPYKCKECGKSFVDSRNFTFHQRIHTGKRPHKCLECGKRFLSKTCLTRHQMIHTGEKPHKCLECGKSFTQKGNLNVHKRLHTGEKPYKCLKCGKSFTQKESLNSHDRSHTGERPYKCLECGKSFFRKGNLNSHKGIHTREKKHINVWNVERAPLGKHNLLLMKGSIQGRDPRNTWNVKSS